MGSSSSAAAAENPDSCTEVKTERIVYNWSIMKFNLLPQDAGEEICSPWFYSQDKSERWHLLFYPRGDQHGSLKSSEYVALYLARDSPGKSKIRVSVELKISKSNIILKDLSITLKYGPQEMQGCPKFLERSKLLTTNFSDDDRFTIICIIDIPIEAITLSSNETICDLQKKQLSINLFVLSNDPPLSDFTIIVEDIKFRTHKVILARHSPIFAAIFKNKSLKVNRENEMKIYNIQPDVIRGMLEFIYTGRVTNLEELASGLLEVADKYDLEGLRIMCEKTLCEGLNKMNAAEILRLADLHHADTLKKCVMKYIVDHVPELLKSYNWMKTGWNLELLLESLDQLALSKTANNKKSQCSMTEIIIAIFQMLILVFICYLYLNVR